MINDPSRGIGFEAGDAFVQFRGLGNEMQMIPLLFPRSGVGTQRRTL